MKNKMREIKKECLDANYYTNYIAYYNADKFEIRISSNEDVSKELRMLMELANRVVIGDVFSANLDYMHWLNYRLSKLIRKADSCYNIDNLLKENEVNS